MIYEAAVYAKTGAAFEFLKTAFVRGDFQVPALTLSLLPNPSVANIKDIQVRAQFFVSVSW